MMELQKNNPNVTASHPTPDGANGTSTSKPDLNLPKLFSGIFAGWGESQVSTFSEFASSK